MEFTQQEGISITPSFIYAERVYYNVDENIKKFNNFQNFGVFSWTPLNRMEAKFDI